MSIVRLAIVTAVLTAVTAATAQPAEALPPPIYSLKQETANTGSNIRRNAVVGSRIPLNRRYSELTREEQDMVKSAYEPMYPLDEPPFPADGLLPIFTAVRTVQHEVFARGELTMFVEIDAQGQATQVSVVKSPDPKLTQAMASVLMLTKYKPAVCRGQPCRMGYPLRMTFGVER